MKLIDADAFEKYAWSNPDIEVDGEPYISPSAVQNFATDHPIVIDQPNDPLTLDELRNIGNVPVWLVWGYEMSEWALIGPYDDIYMEALVFDGDGELFRIDEYGEEWKVYRRPPEGEANA